MNCELMHPADQIVLIMNRIYTQGLTTTSGGNLSICDGSGNVWITPSGVDKGSLTRGDICLIKPDGSLSGPHKPSVELPFHLSVYNARPDIKAILHAHPPMLISFSIARVVPAVNLTASSWRICGKTAMAPYAVPGSAELSDAISGEFAKGFDIVLLEKHGVVIGAEDLSAAFMKFETFESAAKTEICARRLGKPIGLNEPDLSRSLSAGYLAQGEFKPDLQSEAESCARSEMVDFIQRAYRQKLITSTQGTFSYRLDGNTFLITPDGPDRACIDAGDLVLIRSGMTEHGKTSSRFTLLHQAVYELNPDIRSIICANPPHAMAFSVTDEPFDPRIIPESYNILRESGKIPFADIYERIDAVAARLSNRSPVLLCRNNTIISTGDSMLRAFDRLEITEATARSIINAKAISEIVLISDSEIAEVARAFNLFE